MILRYLPAASGPLLTGPSWEVSVSKGKTVILLTTVVCGLTVSGGMALAANVISCSGGLCEGTTGNDKMTGTDRTDYIYAKEGNDTLRGLESFDDLRGGPGNDDLDGGRGSDQYNVYDTNWGADVISGDAGGSEDWLIFQISAVPLMVDLVPKSGRAEVSSGANRINIARGVEIEWVQAGPANDSVKGNGAANYLSGAGGSDRLLGRGGPDTLRGDIVEFGNVGHDTLEGGPGEDDLEGGPGGDDLLGGEENDEISDVNDPSSGAANDFDEAFGGPGIDTINVQDGDQFDVVCTGGGADPAPTIDPGDVVDDPNFCN
jgi:Ca2+-binding RTX toxin-like protein